MFLPIGDSPNPRYTPLVNYGLIAVNVGVFVLLLPQMFTEAAPGPELVAYLKMLAAERGLTLRQVQALAEEVSAYDLLVFEHGYLPGKPSVADAFTAMFLHGGLAHIAGNMLFLWIYGDNVEHRLGKAAYLGAYLVTGLVATLSDGLLRSGSFIPAVGASGAISGVLGAYFVWFPQNRVRIFVFLFPFFADTIEVKARWVLGFYIIVSNILPALFTSSAGGGVAYGAHIGGFVAGMALAWLVDRHLQRPEPSVRAPRGGWSPQAEASIPGAFRQALDRGDLGNAAALLFDAPRSETRTAIGAYDKVELGEQLAAAGHPRAALQAFHRALGDHPTGPGRASAHMGVARLMMGPFAMPTAAFNNLMSALDEAENEQDDREARELLDELQGRTARFPRY